MELNVHLSKCYVFFLIYFRLERKDIGMIVQKLKNVVKVVKWSL